MPTKYLSINSEGSSSSPTSIPSNSYSIYRFSRNSNPLSSLGKSFFSSSLSYIWGVFRLVRKQYHFRTSSFFRLPTLSSNGAFGGLSIVLRLYVGVECGVGEVPQFASAADVLSALFVFASLPHLFLFLIGFAFSFDVVLHHIIVDHIHAFVGLSDARQFLLEATADRQKLVFVLFVDPCLLRIHFLFAPPFDDRVYDRHLIISNISTQFIVKQFRNLIFMSINNSKNILYFFDSSLMLQRHPPLLNKNVRMKATLSIAF